MKRLFAVFLVVAMTLSIATISALALPRGGAGNHGRLNNGGICNFVCYTDANGDGVCAGMEQPGHQGVGAMSGHGNGVHGDGHGHGEGRE